MWDNIDWRGFEKSHQVMTPDNATTNQQVCEWMAGVTPPKYYSIKNQQAQLHPVPTVQAMPRIYRACSVLLMNPRTL
jgi:hypothetical protein